MKIRHYLALSILAAAVGCRAPLAVQKVDAQDNIRILADMPEDPAMKAVIAPYKASMEKQMNTKVSYTAQELNKSGDNSALGNLLADYTYEAGQRWAAQQKLPPVDAAVINSGGIRSIIGKGDILVKNVFEVMPFENELVIVKLSGAEMQGLFDFYRRSQKNNPVSHLNIEIKNGQLARALVNGAPVRTDRDYYIATSDFLALGGDNMDFFSRGELIATGLRLRDLYLEEFKRNPEIIVNVEQRLIFDRQSKTNEP